MWPPRVLEGHQITCLDPFIRLGSLNKNVAQADPSAVEASLTHPGDPMTGLAQSGSLDVHGVTDIPIDTPKVKVEKKSWKLNQRLQHMFMDSLTGCFKDGMLRCPVYMAGCYVDRPAGIYDIFKNRCRSLSEGPKRKHKYDWLRQLGTSLRSIGSSQRRLILLQRRTQRIILTLTRYFVRTMRKWVQFRFRLRLRYPTTPSDCWRQYKCKSRARLVAAPKMRSSLLRNKFRLGTTFCAVRFRRGRRTFDVKLKSLANTRGVACKRECCGEDDRSHG